MAARALMSVRHVLLIPCVADPAPVIAWMTVFQALAEVGGRGCEEDLNEIHRAVLVQRVVLVAAFR